MSTYMLGHCVAFTVMSVPKPFSGQRPFQSPEIKSVPSVTQPVPAEIGGRWRKAMLGV